MYVPDENGNNTAQGDSVKAVSSGIVTLKKNKGDTEGWVIVLFHTQENVYSAYWHLTNIPAGIFEGAEVEAGEVIGKVLERSYEGRFPEVHPFLDDAHLHFEIRTVPDLLDAYESEACNDLGWEEGVGYTHPNHPESYGFLDPIAFLSERINTLKLYLPVISRGITSTCQPNQNLLLYGNPGFEGPTASPAPWIEISTHFDPYPELHYYYHIVEDDSYQAYSGNHSAIFGDQVIFTWPVDEQLLQSIVIPNNTETLQWQAYVKLNRDYTGNLQDYFILSLKDAATGESLAEDVVIDYGFNMTEDVWMLFTVEYDHVGSLVGRQVSLSYTGFADGDVHPATLRVDDVKLLTTVCDPNPQGGPIIVNVTTQNNSTPTPLPPTLTPTPTNTPEPTATPTVTPTPTATVPGDQYEPNETYNTAYDLNDDMGTIQLNQLYTFNAKISTAIDKDWFKFEVPGNLACQVYDLTLTLENIPPGVNYDLELYGSDPFTPLEYSDNTGNQDENLTYTYEPVTSGDTFRARIYSAGGFDPNQQYLFSIQVTCNFALAYEPNNTFADAHKLGTLPNNEKVMVQAAIWPTTDEDWFTFYLAPISTDPPSQGQILTIWLEVPAGMDYNLALYRSNGQLITASTQPEGTAEYISYQVTHPGWYYLRVYALPTITNETEMLAYELELLYTP